MYKNHDRRRLCPWKVFRFYRRQVKTRLLCSVLMCLCTLLSCGVLILTVNLSSNGRHSHPQRPLLENSYRFQGIYHHRTLLNASDTTSERSAEYPEDEFTLEQKQQGAVICHIIGMCYMFLALAIACDEFFVPSLTVIIEKLELKEDVAGATFMAAGGSAPELFTSFIGTFIDPKSNVGIGTIVGSAVFNVLFVIGMCAMFSKGVLELTWWPLFRDCIFYSLALIILIIFFLSGDVIVWWESLVLLLCYFAYVIFMKYNHNVERRIKGLFGSNKVSSMDMSSAEAINPGVNRTDLYLEKALEYLGSASKQTTEMQCFNFVALQLVVQTIDPIGDASIAAKATRLKQLSSAKQPATESQDRQLYTYSNYDLSNGTRDLESAGYPRAVSSVQVYGEENHNSPSPIPGACQEKCRANEESMSKHSRESKVELCGVSDETEEELLEEDEQPIDLSWPESGRDRVFYVIKAPLMFLMYYTMVDVRRPERRHLYPITFLMSIFWIAFFSYFMVWWATEVGYTFDIPTEVMGLTFLAAGTSVPDLITSVLVARKGFGDMAVSSSIGSNLFDITVGLPLPWLCYSAVNLGLAVNVSSRGILYSVIMLFCMLIAVVVSIAASRWRMSKSLGACMFVFYIIFLVLAVLLALGKI
ncbi:predicted protein [Nematostella vectensis]|uniref:Sodium/calcium exchanger membrane region domain-containing protein n=1 Tax=Nematostella vectensis TaxID=45351 RepID=A7S4I7_NEMVE|nr:predicted protein [Nematostella vectensis]|eukprot:XP_001633484.1 predicted protein [Nematostella vectensis]